MVEQPAPETVRTISDLLETKARKLGNETLFHYNDTEYSYNTVEENANLIANNLRSRGISKGDIVCIFMYNRPEYLYTLFALAKIGAITAPIDTRFTGDSLVHVLSETETPVVVLDGDTRERYEEVRERVSNVGAEFLVTSTAADGSYREFDQLLEDGATTAPDVDVQSSDTCSIIYVQRYQRKHPQGVMLPHHSYINTGWESAQNLFDLDSSDCIFATLPFYSSYPIQIGLTGAMLSEAEFAFEKQFQREQFWDWVRKYNATLFLYLGRMLSVLHNQQQDPRDGNNPTKFAFGYGFGVETDEAMIAEFERRFDITVIQGYGITPNATVATSNRPGSRNLGSVGRPVSHAEVGIVDENDWLVPTGETGEIVIRSERPNTMMQRFFKDPELTEEVCRNRWIHTNDIGYKDEDGFVYFVANKTDTIELGRVAGRISSLEIESVMDSHPDVSESVVFGVSGGGDDEAIKAVVIPENDQLTPIDVSNHCERQLSYHKLPRYIEIRDNLPRNSADKVQKDALQETQTSKGVWDREGGYNLQQ